MKKIIVLAAAVLFLFSSSGVYAQTDQTGYLNKNKYELANKFSKLKEFSYPNTSINSLDAESLRSGLNILPPQRREEVLAGFKEAVAFFFSQINGVPGAILTVMELKTPAAAVDFIKAEKEVMKAKDTAYKKYIKSSAYDSVAIAPGENALISRKVMTEGATTREITVIVAARGNYLVELNYLQGKQSNDKLKKDVQDIWKVMAK